MPACRSAVRDDGRLPSAILRELRRVHTVWVRALSRPVNQVRQECVHCDQRGGSQDVHVFRQRC